MRLLHVNANTSEFVTAKVADAARRASAPGTEIVPVTGRFGARVIATRTELAVAEHATVELLARHAPGCDAVLIAVSERHGLPARLQAQVDVPLLDGVNCGVRQAELLAGLGAIKPRVGSYAPLPVREMVDVHPALIARFASKP